MGLGHDIRAGLTELSAEQFRDVIAYGAGWTDRERQQPVGESGRTEPRQADAITPAELQRALADPDPLHGIAQLVARWGAAFLLDPDGVTRRPHSAPIAWRADSARRCPTALARYARRYGH